VLAGQTDAAIATGNGFVVAQQNLITDIYKISTAVHTTNNNFWSGLGRCDDTNTTDYSAWCGGDPQVVYDSFNSHFVFGAISLAPIGPDLYLAYSSTNDPTGTTKRHVITNMCSDTSSNFTWVDRPVLAVTGKWIVLEYNCFKNDGGNNVQRELSARRRSA
jgi:hypothetical protein